MSGLLRCCLAARIVHRPAAVLSIGVVLFGALALSTLGYKSEGVSKGIAPPVGSDSAAGTAAQATYFPKASANPTLLVYKMGTSVWTDATPLATGQQQLTSSTIAGTPSQFTTVAGPLDPAGQAPVGISYLAALGLAVLIFPSGLTFILPFLMFVFLLALGEDYNILVMTRIREEAHHLSLRQAVSKALGATGTTVSSAGLVLAGTFAVFALAGGSKSGNNQLQEIGFGLAAGIVMDTFLVRTLLVPSTVVLLGRPHPMHRLSSCVTRHRGLVGLVWLIAIVTGGYAAGALGPVVRTAACTPAGDPAVQAALTSLATPGSRTSEIDITFLDLCVVHGRSCTERPEVVVKPGRHQHGGGL